MLALIFVLMVQTCDTLTVRTIAHPPRPDTPIDSVALGEPTIRMRTGQGSALVWLLRADDTVFIAASIPDSTPYWGDDFVISLDTRGDAAPSPQHDDFQLDFRRVIDSSVVYRGRNGRWEPPKGDPDWRLGADRAGGGWEVSAGGSARGWNLLLRMDPAWFAGDPGQLPRIAFRIYDDSPPGWFAWPRPQGRAPATTVEQVPQQWSPVR